MIRIAIFLFGALLFGVSQAEPIQIVAFGGSNTYGKGVSRSEAYPAQLEAMLRTAGYDIVVKNEGTSGQTTSDELRKVNSAIPNGTRIVIYHPGGNDTINKNKFGQVNDTEGNITTIIQTLLDRKILVLFVGKIANRQYVKNFKIRIINKRIQKMAPNDMQYDGMHLTPNGYKLVAEKMLPHLKVMLDKVRENDAQPSGSRP